MNSKMRCAGCKDYFPAEDMYRTTRMQNFCSEECFWGDSRRHAPQKRRRPTIAKKAPANTIPPEVRKLVTSRDQSCRFCGTTNGLHLHHIVYRSQGGQHEVSNLILLCHEHHALVHSNKKRWFPVLRAYVWLQYTEGARLPLSLLEKKLLKQGLLPVA